MAVHFGVLRAPSSKVMDGTFVTTSFDSTRAVMRVFHTHVHNLVCTWARLQVAKRLGWFGVDRHKSDCFEHETRRMERSEPKQPRPTEPV
mmetsp:Transcript_2562/g.9151  ORF Transcript_2562/g.9151 Transcript_2562/m.9151 type:complete len:90 (+) Transcript_2562:1615-1884(+)